MARFKLIVFKSYRELLESGHALDLQNLLREKDLTALFTNYTQRFYPNITLLDDQFLVEKSILIGLLMREWFATKLLENTNALNDMVNVDNTKNIQKIFANYLVFRAEGLVHDQLLSDEEGSKYDSNKEFLEYCISRNNNHTTDEHKFKKYFSQQDVGGVDVHQDIAIARYWREEGFRTYCHYLAQISVKVSLSDVTPVLNQINQRVSETAQNFTDETFVIARQAEAGHYKLVSTAATSDALSRYGYSYAQYVEHRKSIVAIRTIDDRSAAAEKASSLLVGAICPPNTFADNPVQYLIKRLITIAGSASATLSGNGSIPRSDL